MSQDGDKPGKPGDKSAHGEAAKRLDRSRLALIEFVHRKEGRKETRRPRVDAQRGGPNDASPGRTEGDGEQWEAAEAAAANARGGWFHRVKRAAKTYWYHHPARMGLDMATPLLTQYARKSPGTYLGVAAVAGAVFMVARPWRLLSVTGVLVALAKSPQLAAVVMAAMSGAEEEQDTDLPY